MSVTRTLRFVLSLWLAALLIIGCKDEDPKPLTQVVFASEQRNVLENVGEIEIEVRLNRPAPQATTLHYSLGGTARRRSGSSSDGDYEITNNPGKIEISQGSTRAILKIKILDNSIIDDDRSIRITLDKIDGDKFELGELTETVIIISDDGDSEDPGEEPGPRVKVSFAAANVTVNENQEELPVVVELNDVIDEDVVVQYSIEGTATRKTDENTTAADYEISGTVGEILIPKGETSGTINIRLLKDNTLESGETIVLTIEGTNNDLIEIGERPEITITISNNDVEFVASFQTISLAVNEADAGLHEIFVSLNQAPSTDVVVKYQIEPWLVNNQAVSGIAIDSLSAYEAGISAEYYDYFIDGTSGELTIPAGQTSAAIRINVLSDFHLEDTETIEFTLIASPGIVPGTANKAMITITQEDGRVIALDWGGEGPTDADMDLWIWFTVDEGVNWYPFIFSVVPGNAPPEIGFIPNTFVMELEQQEFHSIKFGISAIYYSGTADPLDFRTIIADFADDDIEPVDQREITDASYGIVNINPWDDPLTGTDPIVVQTFTYENGAYGPASDITVPDERSRVATVKIPNHLMGKKKGRIIRQINRRVF